VINPPQGIAEWDANNSSVVIKLKYKDVSMLFCGDASDKAMENILKYSSFLKSDVLKVPHHGGSTGKEAVAKMFFEEVSPRVSIISSAADLYLKDSSQENLYSSSVIYSTKKSGAIEIITDGSTFTIKPFCQ
jgi:competence protein ComEC